MDVEELNKGIKLCIKNANRLLEEARLLEDEERYESSAFLGLTSMEEAAKALKLMDYKRSGTKLTKSQWKKNFLSHWDKLKESMKRRGEYYNRTSPSVKGTYSRKSYTEWFAEEHTNLREYSLYVDRDFEASEWKNPSENTWLDKDWVQYILYGAELTIQLAEEEYANS